MMNLSPLSDFIERAVADAGLNNRTLAERMGYRNIAKGIRKVSAMRAGDVRLIRARKAALADALRLSEGDLDHAITDALACAKAIYDRAQDPDPFEPHATVITAYSVPSPIFAAAIAGTPGYRRISLDASRAPVTFVSQVLPRLPEGIPGFGRTVGFVIHYTPDRSVRFDRQGSPVSVGDGAKVAGDRGTAVATLKGRPIPGLTSSE